MEDVKRTSPEDDKPGDKKNHIDKNGRKIIYKHKPQWDEFHRVFDPDGDADSSAYGGGRKRIWATGGKEESQNLSVEDLKSDGGLGGKDNHV